MNTQAALEIMMTLAIVLMITNSCSSGMRLMECIRFPFAQIFSIILSGFILFMSFQVYKGTW